MTPLTTLRQTPLHVSDVVDVPPVRRGIYESALITERAGLGWRFQTINNRTGIIDPDHQFRLLATKHK